MPVKLTIKAKDFICIYTSGAEQFGARCLSPAEGSAVRAPTRPRVGLLRGGRGRSSGTCQRGPQQLRLPLSLRAV